MPEAVLAGLDGQAAIDQQTGQQLTMEELLRRRGILYRGGARDVSGQSLTPSVVPNTSSASNVANTSSASPTMLSAGVNPAVAALASRNGANISGSSGSSGSASASATQPQEVSPEELEAAGIDEAGAMDLETAGMIAVGSAAAYAAYRAMKGNGAATATVVPDSTALAPMKSANPNTSMQGETVQGNSPPMKALPAPNQSVEASTTQARPKELSSVKQLAENKKRARARETSKGTTLKNNAKPVNGYKAKEGMTASKYDSKGKLISGTVPKTESAVTRELAKKKLSPQTIQTVLKTLF